MPTQISLKVKGYFTLIPEGWQGALFLLPYLSPC